MKTTPIPVKFDRQGHSCNFYAGFGPTGAARGRHACAQAWPEEHSSRPIGSAGPPCCARISEHRRRLRVPSFPRAQLAGPSKALLVASQRSLHNAPIFRLLLKVAVNGTHQCDFLNFCGAFMPQHTRASARKLSVLSFARSGRHSRLNRRRMGFRCLFGTEDLQVCLGNFEQSSGVNLPG